MAAMIGDVQNAVNFEVAVAAGHALHFHFVRNVRAGSLLIDVQVDDFRANVGGELELIAAGGQAAAQVITVDGRLLCAAHGALAAVLRYRHRRGKQEHGCDYQKSPHRTLQMISLCLEQ
jgi:hypothetical protein